MQKIKHLISFLTVRGVSCQDQHSIRPSEDYHFSSLIINLFIFLLLSCAQSSDRRSIWASSTASPVLHKYTESWGWKKVKGFLTCFVNICIKMGKIPIPAEKRFNGVTILYFKPLLPLHWHCLPACTKYFPVLYKPRNIYVILLLSLELGKWFLICDKHF